MVVSAILMWRRFMRALRLAVSEQAFVPVLSAGIALVLIGTVTFAIGNGWSPVDAFYYSICTLTTSSVADPELTISDPWLKVFSALYIVLGIGIAVEIARRLGMAFVELQRRDRAERAARRAPAA